jgi:hypothetical protein
MQVSSQIAYSLPNWILSGVLVSQASFQQCVLAPLPTVWMSPHLNRCFTLWRLFQNWDPNVSLDLKKTPCLMYLAFSSLAQRLSCCLYIFQIYLVIKYSLKTWVFITPGLQIALACKLLPTSPCGTEITPAPLQKNLDLMVTIFLLQPPGNK